MKDDFNRSMYFDFFFFFGDLFKSYQLGFIMCLNTAYFAETEKLLLKVL